jgi:hypothetical protein
MNSILILNHSNFFFKEYSYDIDITPILITKLKMINVRYIITNKTIS